MGTIASPGWNPVGVIPANTYSTGVVDLDYDADGKILVLNRSNGTAFSQDISVFSDIPLPHRRFRLI